MSIIQKIRNKRLLYVTTSEAQLTLEPIWQKSFDTAVAAYSRDVDRYADEQSGEAFWNDGMSCASVVINKLVDVSRSAIYIYSKSLDLNFYSEVFERLRAVVKQYPELEVKILVENYGLHVSSLIGDIARVSVRELLSPASDVIGTHHFVVVDRKHYREEYDHHSASARCSFGDSSTSNRLAQKFELAWKLSAPLANKPSFN
jgi:hypothetical protein